jgi:ribonuclease HII
MAELDAEHPAYGWIGNKGYGSSAHQQAIGELGVTKFHRVSWNIQ